MDRFSLAFTTRPVPLARVGSLTECGTRYPVFEDPDGRLWTWEDADLPAGRLCPALSFDPEPSRPHVWQTARFTGNRTCSRCGLLPLDDSDVSSDCTGGAR